MTTPVATSATTVKNNHESGARFGTRSIALQEYVVWSDAPYRSCRYEQLRRMRQPRTNVTVSNQLNRPNGLSRLVRGQGLRCAARSPPSVGPTCRPVGATVASSLEN